MFSRRNILPAACCLWLLTAQQAHGISSSQDVEFALDQHRQLQGNPGAFCGVTIGNLITCYAQKCAAEECDVEPGVVPDAPPNPEASGCDALEEGFCSNFDIDCCTPCEAEMSEYLQCVIGSSFLHVMCPGASCSEAENSNNMTMPEGNMTTADSNMTISDAMPEVAEGDMPGGAIEDPSVGAEDSQSDEFCVMAIAEVFGCYIGSCAERECDTQLDNVDPEEGGPPTIDNCNEFTEAFCDAFAAADRCCPECAHATSAYATCALKSRVSEYCPNASCHASAKAIKSVATSRTNELSESKEAAYATESSSSSRTTGLVASMVGLFSLLL